MQVNIGANDGVEMESPTHESEPSFGTQAAEEAPMAQPPTALPNSAYPNLQIPGGLFFPSQMPFAGSSSESPMSDLLKFQALPAHPFSVPDALAQQVQVLPDPPLGMPPAPPASLLPTPSGRSDARAPGPGESRAVSLVPSWPVPPPPSPGLRHADGAHAELVDSLEEDGPASAREIWAPVGPHPTLDPRLGISDIDAGEEDNALVVSEYVNTIFYNMLVRERRYRPIGDYMAVTQNDINNHMRAILIDWLIDVAGEYQLSSETLYLAVNYLDRFLSIVPVRRTKLQLVGIASVFLASKFEEVQCPTLDQFVYICDYSFTKDQILVMERYILNGLRFGLASVTPRNFLKRFLKAACADSATAFLAYFLTELSLMNVRFVKYLPSVISASAVSLALHTTNKHPWTPTLEYYTSHSFGELRECIADLHESYRTCLDSNLQAVVYKYAHSRFHRVARIPCPATLPSV
eukprot:gnl/Trimastix_PCT/3725.p1 GENE.gnl/Trimastix_PCT/3725~~gnl/Trimastix_PCT/3725.p1  ORF type:complete len:528 (-),score=128.63 gnl/Trimastix_PCT/3725:213-1604(-)